MMEQRANSPNAIGERLRALLVVTSLAIEDMAHITGTSKRHVAEWLEGGITPPRGRMSRLAQQTGVTLAWIYYGDNGRLGPLMATRLRLAVDRGKADRARATLSDGTT